MKRVMLILAMALAACVFATPESADVRAAREKEERAWAKRVSSRYDLNALFTFLKETIAERQSWDGISLTTPKIGSGWKIQGHVMVTGDWSFFAFDGGDHFTMSFIYHAENGDRRLVMRCVRPGKNVFRLLGIETEEVDSARSKGPTSRQSQRPQPSRRVLTKESRNEETDC